MAGPLCKHGWSIQFCGPCSADHFFKSQAKGPRDGDMLAMEPENVPEAVWRAAMSAYHKTLRKNPTMAWQVAVSAALKALTAPKQENREMSSVPTDYSLANQSADERRAMADRIAQLEAALREIAKTTYGWEPGVWSDKEAYEYFASLFFGAQSKARAALEERT